MTEYSLYLDDSGHPDNQPYVVVAGYVASEAQWLAFEPEWKSTLAKYQLGDVFHMTDFMATRSRYTTLRLDQILGSLASVIKKHTVCPFFCAVDVAAYKRVNDEFTLQECHGAPFAIATRAIWRDIHIWQRTLPAGDRFLAFVEEGTKHYGEMEQVLKRDGVSVPNRVPKSTPQAQPADMLAWEGFNWLRAGHPRKMGPNLDRLTKPIRRQQNFGGCMFEHDLRKICEDTNVMLRAIIKDGDTIAFHSDKKRKRKRTIK